MNSTEFQTFLNTNNILLDSIKATTVKNKSNHGEADNKNESEQNNNKPDKRRVSFSAQNSYIYWLVDSSACYLPARVPIQQYETGATRLMVELVTNKKKIQVDRNSLTSRIYSLESLDNFPDDLIDCDEISEGSILWNIRKRFEKNKIYSNIGPILISVNPYEWIKEIYSKDKLLFFTKSLFNRFSNDIDGNKNNHSKSHVYALAKEAFISLRDTGKVQSMIITGESGAGKTETTKKCLEYFTFVTSEGVTSTEEKEVGTISKVSSIQDKILHTNPILEAFGNAKTIRNDNSSRFGKWIEIQFTKEQGRSKTGLSIMSAKNVTYLLEKSRVVQLGYGERSYHIFYQLCAGYLLPSFRHLELAPPQSFSYLSSGGCFTIDGLNDTEALDETLEAMKICQFSREDQDAIFRIVASILHLGNIKFEENSSGYATLTSESQSTFQLVEKLLQVESEEDDEDDSGLGHDLVVRLMKISSNTTKVPLEISAAETSRNSLAKALYDRLFYWLVERLNTNLIQENTNPNLSKSIKSNLFIGVLDIFGFEIFEHNSLEQLCINFANEKLEEFFIHTIFTGEISLYNQEGITGIEEVNVVNNAPVLELIEGRKSGIFDCIEEGIQLNFTDDKLLNRLSQIHAKHERFFKDFKMKRNHFVISHYAGKVTYEIDDFILKSRDRLHDHLMSRMANSSLTLVSTLFANEKSPEVSSSLSHTSLSPQSPSSNKRKTIGSLFQTQLSSLMSILYSSKPYFIRCIKPNSSRTPRMLEPALVLEQLRYSGVLEALRVIKSGFPHRESHNNFISNYWFLVKGGQDIFNRRKESQEYEKTDVCSALCSELVDALQRLNSIFMNLKLGTTLVFCSTEIVKVLHITKLFIQKQKLSTLQRISRGHLSRKKSNILSKIRCDLRLAIEERSLEKLENLIEKSISIEYKWPEYLEGNTLMETLRAESKIIKDIEVLQQTIKENLAESDIIILLEQLREILNQAHDLNMDSFDEVKEVKVWLPYLDERVQLLVKLRKGILNRSFEGISIPLKKINELIVKDGEFCKQDVEVATQWYEKLVNEKLLTDDLISVIEKSLMNTKENFVEQMFSSEEQYIEENLEKKLAKEITENLLDKAKLVEESNPVGKDANDARLVANLLITLREALINKNIDQFLSTMKEYKKDIDIYKKLKEEEIMLESTDLEGKEDISIPHKFFFPICLELQYFEFLYFTSFLALPLKSAIEKNRVIGHCGRIDSDIDAQPLYDVLCRTQYLICHTSPWIKSFISQARAVYKLRCAWIKEDMTALIDALQKAETLESIQYIDEEIQCARYEIKDIELEKELRLLIQEEIKSYSDESNEFEDETGSSKVLLPWSEEQTNHFDNLANMYNEENISNTSKRLITSIQLLNSFRDYKDKGDWETISTYFSTCSITYHESTMRSYDGNDGDLIDEDGSKIYDLDIRPIIEILQGLTQTWILANVLKGVIQKGKLTGSISHPNFPSKESVEEFQSVIMECKEKGDTLTEEALFLIRKAEFLLSLKTVSLIKESSERILEIDKILGSEEAEIFKMRDLVSYDSERPYIDAEEEIQFYNCHVAYVKGSQELNLALSNGDPVGLPNKIEPKSVDTTKLENALSICQDENLRPSNPFLANIQDDNLYFLWDLIIAGELMLSIRVAIISEEWEKIILLFTDKKSYFESKPTVRRASTSADTLIVVPTEELKTKFLDIQKATYQMVLKLKCEEILHVCEKFYLQGTIADIMQDRGPLVRINEIIEFGSVHVPVDGEIQKLCSTLKYLQKIRRSFFDEDLSSLENQIQFFSSSIHNEDENLIEELLSLRNLLKGKEILRTLLDALSESRLIDFSIGDLDLSSNYEDYMASLKQSLSLIQKEENSTNKLMETFSEKKLVTNNEVKLSKIYTFKEISESIYNWRCAISKQNYEETLNNINYWKSNEISIKEKFTLEGQVSFYETLCQEVKLLEGESIYANILEKANKLLLSKGHLGPLGTLSSPETQENLATESLDRLLAHVKSVKENFPFPEFLKKVENSLDTLSKLRKALSSSNWIVVLEMLDLLNPSIATPLDHVVSPRLRSEEEDVIVTGGDYPGIRLKEIEFSQFEYENNVAEKYFIDALNTGIITGKVGAISTEGVNIEEIDHAIEYADSLEQKSERVHQLYTLAEGILQIRSIMPSSVELEQSQGPIECLDWTNIEKILSDVKALDPKVVEVADGEIELLQAERDCVLLQRNMINALLDGKIEGEVGYLGNNGILIDNTGLQNVVDQFSGNKLVNEVEVLQDLNGIGILTLRLREVLKPILEANKDTITIFDWIGDPQHEFYSRWATVDELFKKFNKLVALKVNHVGCKVVKEEWLLLMNQRRLDKVYGGLLCTLHKSLKAFTTQSGRIVPTILEKCQKDIFDKIDAAENFRVESVKAEIDNISEEDNEIENNNDNKMKKIDYLEDLLTATYLIAALHEGLLSDFTPDLLTNLSNAKEAIKKDDQVLGFLTKHLLWCQYHVGKSSMTFYADKDNAKGGVGCLDYSIVKTQKLEEAVNIFELSHELFSAEDLEWISSFKLLIKLRKSQLNILPEKLETMEEANQIALQEIIPKGSSLDKSVITEADRQVQEMYYYQVLSSTMNNIRKDFLRGDPGDMLQPYRLIDTTSLESEIQKMKATTKDPRSFMMLLIQLSEDLLRIRKAQYKLGKLAPNSDIHENYSLLGDTVKLIVNSDYYKNSQSYFGHEIPKVFKDEIENAKIDFINLELEGHLLKYLNEFHIQNPIKALSKSNSKTLPTLGENKVKASENKFYDIDFNTNWIENLQNQFQEITDEGKSIDNLHPRIKNLLVTSTAILRFRSLIMHNGWEKLEEEVNNFWRTEEINPFGRQEIEMILFQCKLKTTLRKIAVEIIRGRFSCFVGVTTIQENNLVDETMTDPESDKMKVFSTSITNLESILRDFSEILESTAQDYYFRLPFLAKEQITSIKYEGQTLLEVRKNISTKSFTLAWNNISKMLSMNISDPVKNEIIYYRNEIVHLFKTNFLIALIMHFTQCHSEEMLLIVLDIFKKENLLHNLEYSTAQILNSAYKELKVLAQFKENIKYILSLDECNLDLLEKTIAKAKRLGTKGKEMDAITGRLEFIWKFENELREAILSLKPSNIDQVLMMKEKSQFPSITGSLDTQIWLVQLHRPELLEIQLRYAIFRRKSLHVKAILYAIFKHYEIERKRTKRMMEIDEEDYFDQVTRKIDELLINISENRALRDIATTKEKLKEDKNQPKIEKGRSEKKKSLHSKTRGKHLLHGKTEKKTEEMQILQQKHRMNCIETTILCHLYESHILPLVAITATEIAGFVQHSININGIEYHRSKSEEHLNNNSHIKHIERLLQIGSEHLGKTYRDNILVFLIRELRNIQEEIETYDPCILMGDQENYENNLCFYLSYDDDKISIEEDGEDEIDLYKIETIYNTKESEEYSYRYNHPLWQALAACLQAFPPSTHELERSIISFLDRHYPHKYIHPSVRRTIDNEFVQSPWSIQGVDLVDILLQHHVSEIKMQDTQSKIPAWSDIFTALHRRNDKRKSSLFQTLNSKKNETFKKMNTDDYKTPFDIEDFAYLTSSLLSFFDKAEFVGEGKLGNTFKNNRILQKTEFNDIIASSLISNKDTQELIHYALSEDLEIQSQKQSNNITKYDKAIDKYWRHVKEIDDSTDVKSENFVSKRKLCRSLIEKKIEIGFYRAYGFSFKGENDDSSKKLQS